jgi:WD40 repeat protein
LLRPDSLAVTGRLDGHTPVNGLAFTQDGRRLVSWAGNRDSPDGESVVVWDLAGRKPAGPAFGQVWPDHGGGLLADRSTLLLLQHGRDPATAPSVVAWNIDARTPSTAYDLPTAGVDTVVVAPSGGLVALGSAALGPLVLNPATGEQWRLPTAGRPLAFSPDGSALVVAAGNAVQLWDLDHRTVRPGAGDGHRGDVVAAAFAADGATLATVGADGAIVLWDARAAHMVRSIPGFARPVRSVVFGADGRTLFTAGDDGALVAWDLQGGRGLAARLPQWSPVALACAVAGRDLSPEEWRRFLPDRSYLHVCPA